MKFRSKFKHFNSRKCWMLLNMSSAKLRPFCLGLNVRSPSTVCTDRNIIICTDAWVPDGARLSTDTMTKSEICFLYGVTRGVGISDVLWNFYHDDVIKWKQYGHPTHCNVIVMPYWNYPFTSFIVWRKEYCKESNNERNNYGYHIYWMPTKIHFHIHTSTIHSDPFSQITYSSSGTPYIDKHK